MKFLQSLALSFMLLVGASFAQTTYAVSVYHPVGVQVTGPLGGRSVTLTTTAPIAAIFVNGVQDANLTNGVITFKTGNKVTGNQMIGDVFGSGGTITVSSDDLGVIYSGTFTSATWTPLFAPNLTHYYQLSGNTIDANNVVGGFNLYTTVDTSITCFFSGSETVSTLLMGFVTN